MKRVVCGLLASCAASAPPNAIPGNAIPGNAIPANAIPNAAPEQTHPPNGFVPLSAMQQLEKQAGELASAPPNAIANAATSEQAIGLEQTHPPNALVPLVPQDTAMQQQLQQQQLEKQAGELLQAADSGTNYAALVQQPAVWEMCLLCLRTLESLCSFH
jgi:hypothetical protein